MLTLKDYRKETEKYIPGDTRLLYFGKYTGQIDYVIVKTVSGSQVKFDIINVYNTMFMPEYDIKSTGNIKGKNVGTYRFENPEDKKFFNDVFLPRLFVTLEHSISDVEFNKFSESEDSDGNKFFSIGTELPKGD